jgi:hypothetical protein
MSVETPRYKSLSLTPLAYCVVSEPLKRIAKLLTMQDFSLLHWQRSIGVLRSGINIIDQIRSILIGGHVMLELLILVLSTIEIPRERHHALLSDEIRLLEKTCSSLALDS